MKYWDGHDEYWSIIEGLLYRICFNTLRMCDVYLKDIWVIIEGYLKIINHGAVPLINIDQITNYAYQAKNSFFLKE